MRSQYNSHLLIARDKCVAFKNKGARESDVQETVIIFLIITMAGYNQVTTA